MGKVFCGLIKLEAFWTWGFGSKARASLQPNGDKDLSPSPQSSPGKGEEDNREPSKLIPFPLAGEG